jgi:G6PDH family F420-dependent oxidoreductase
MGSSVELGYALSSEEFPPGALVRQARRAEQAGFTHALISDHFHPWTSAQGHSPHVWSVLGGIAQVTERIAVGTGVTCPLIRQHPVVVAHAAATVACMMPGRFFLGVGTGENLNEHVVGAGWPAPDARVEMLEEAIVVIRALWTGEETTIRGRFYEVEGARLYTAPDAPIPLMVAAGKPRAARLAGRLGDGLVSVAPDRDLVRGFERAGGGGKPRYGQLTVCWDESEETARRTALAQWPNAGVPGDLSQELPLPEHVEQAASLVREEDIAEKVVCGPDPGRYAEAIAQFADAGFDHVYLHQVGQNQEGFFRFCERTLLEGVAKTASPGVPA